MPDSPLSAILDREATEKDAAEHFTPQIELLRGLADYGSNLVVRACNSSPKGMEDLIICGVLLKQVVAMIDAAERLFSAGAVHAAFLPARSAFEASIYLDFILAKDSRRRGELYYVGNLRSDRMWAERVLPGTLEHAAFENMKKEMGIDYAFTDTVDKLVVAKELADINHVLSQAELAPIDKEFSDLRGKGKRDPEWYKLEGFGTLRQLAKEVHRLAEYEAFYSKGSQVAHSARHRDHIRFVSGMVRFVPIRHLELTHVLITCIVSTTTATYRNVLNRYRPGELPAFVAKYVNEWRDSFRNLRSVKYNWI